MAKAKNSKGSGAKVGMTFAERVYDAVRRIPRGRVATYGQIAEIVGVPGGARAVGNALHVNPFAPQDHWSEPLPAPAAGGLCPDGFVSEGTPAAGVSADVLTSGGNVSEGAPAAPEKAIASRGMVVPCHRVVASDGSLAANFGCPGGTAAQFERLRAEGVPFLEAPCIPADDVAPSLRAEGVAFCGAGNAMTTMAKVPQSPSSSGNCPEQRSKIDETAVVVREIPGPEQGAPGPEQGTTRPEQGAPRPEQGTTGPEQGTTFPRVDLSRCGIVIERHPLEPFLPRGARILFLGSFPPPRPRWSMDFFYPNWINDFWRIQGLIHFGDANHFVASELDGSSTAGKRFDKARIIAFCEAQGLAFYDTAAKVCRWKGNASDEFLEIIEPADIVGMLRQMPDCQTIVSTGGKSAEELAAILVAAGATPLPSCTAVTPVLPLPPEESDAAFCENPRAASSLGGGSEGKPAATPILPPPVGSCIDLLLPGIDPLPNLGRTAHPTPGRTAHLTPGSTAHPTPVSTAHPTPGIAPQLLPRAVRWWRMPSTSRAFPMSLQAKAAHYSRLFK